MKFRTRLERTSGASAVAIGNFDGFHAGHEKIVATLAATAQREGLLSVLLSFHPHPRLFFHQPICLISTDAQRLDVLRRQPLDYLFFIDFARVADIPAATFVNDILLDKLRMQTLIIGQDFRFGRGREGDLAFLRRQAAKASFTVMQARTVRRDGFQVGSSLIRKKLAAGAVEEANHMLGHPYAIEGIVERGAGRGSKLGFPTLNVSTANQILPAGVFHTETRIGRQQFPSLTNIGSAPTFGATADTAAALRIETHVPHFQRMVYGEKVTISFIRKIRAEIQFASSQALQEQIRRDVTSLGI
ncbi:MAG: riboflavin biosynthesis protein RibF [Candidatus Aminicenantes bacterium]|nr:riboflavin biosynthesis protein RibF [Candidatus Aminicenantes bacterium]